MISESMKQEMKVRKAWARAAQTAEMLIVHAVFGPKSIFVQRNKKERIAR
jgi:hypothetical protein